MLLWRRKTKKETPVKLKPSTQVVKPKVTTKEPTSNIPPPAKKKPEAPKNIRKTDKDIRKKFLQTFNQLTQRYRTFDVWRDFITMFACSLSNSVDKTHYEKREERYLKIIKKYNKQEQEKFPELAAYVVMALEENPEQDFLGSIFMELNLGNKSSSQFFAPYHVCEMMAKITEEDVVSSVKEKSYITITDPCCGAGATLIAAVNKAKKTTGERELEFSESCVGCGAGH